MTFSPLFVSFAIRDNPRASGVPKSSCDQSHVKAAMPLEKQFYKTLKIITVFNKDSLLFSTIILQGQSTSRKQVFILMSTPDTSILLSFYSSLCRDSPSISV